MKTGRMMFVAGLLTILMSAIGVWLAGCAVLSTGRIPSPQAGLVLPINRNEGAYAHCRLVEGSWSQDDFFAIDSQTGQPKWAKPALMVFEISSAAGRDFYRTKPLLLKPTKADYTLFIIWTRFTGQVLGVDTVYFSTTGNPFNEYHTDPLGYKTYADRIIYLPSVDTSSVSRLRIHKTLYLGDWLKALIGLP